MRQYIAILYTALQLSVPAYGIELDTLSHFLEDIEITVERNTSPLKGSSTRAIKMSTEYLHRLPKILGNADPMRYTQMLPGIQTNTEYDAGLHIQGCENSHNLISIEGTPIYNASHLLGIFSTFIPSHYSNMSISKNATAAEGYSYIGGIMNMESGDTIPTNTNGEFTIGLMSSQGTMRAPLGKNALLTTSLRISYLNLLYKPLLKIDEGQLLYSFGDINLTYLQKIGNRHTLQADFYSSYDKASVKELTNKNYLNSETTWGNALGAIHWNYRFGQGNLKQSIYFSENRNNLSLKGIYKIGLPSQIYDFGYRSKVTLDNIEIGLSIINHNVTPQVPKFTDEHRVSNETEYKQHTIEGSIYAKYSNEIFKCINYDIALKGDLYSDLEGYTYTALNPYAMIAYDSKKAGRFELSYSHQHQYLLNCGFTSLGLPIEFWISASADNKPQQARCLQFCYNREIFNGKFDISLEGYYKRLYNQVEYNASPFDILNDNYDLNKIITSGHGYNYGVNIMLNKLTGKLTGWASYSFGRARRKFNTFGNKWFSASHERIHEVNAVVTYRIGKRLDIGGTFTYASGTPFTSAKYIYIINNNVLYEFGEYNANRLKDYIRLDLSVNYDIIMNKKNTAGINLSAYNVLCRKNETYYGVQATENSISFQAKAMLPCILPSISFYCKFH